MIDKREDRLYLTDEYGDSILFETYHHRLKDEDRINISWIPKDEKAMEGVEEYDVGLDFNIEEFYEVWEELKTRLSDMSKNKE